MELSDGIKLGAAFLAAFVAGGINSVAGGGTMVSFPTLVKLGMAPLFANATNTVGIWCGSLGSLYGFRRELGRVPRRMFWLLVPAILGGALGAVLLKLTPPGLFDWMVPWLVLFATVLFIVQGAVRKYLEAKVEGSKRKAQSEGEELSEPKGHPAAAHGILFLVGIYGGYFGAGISIMMLAVLGVMGMTEILEMNAMTSLLSLGINGIAGILFIFAGLVSWPYVGVMAVGSVLGGYGAAGIARRIGKTAIRRFIIFVGITVALAMFWRVIHQG